MTILHNLPDVTARIPLAPPPCCPLCQQPLIGFNPRLSLALDYILHAEESLAAAQNLLVPEGEVQL